MSFIMHKNKVGDKTLPWGIPFAWTKLSEKVTVTEKKFDRECSVSNEIFNKNGHVTT